MAAPAAESILHVDMNAFFAAVEVREDQKLLGLPVVVGGVGARAVVAAASYEARIFGIHSAMPAAQARRLCPKAVFLAGNFELYKSVSHNVMAIFRSFTPVVEPLSLDEAFLDVSSTRGLHGEPAVIAQQLRQAVFDAEKLWCTVGVAASKSVAKLASEAAKPKIIAGRIELGTGLKVVPKVDEVSFLRPLPIRALWGVGPKTAERLMRLGITTVGELSDISVEALSKIVGSSHGRHLHQMSNGLDSRSVEPNQAVKSISREETFEIDICDPSLLHAEIVRLADSVAGSLRAENLRARTVTLKARYGTFETITRSRTIDRPTSSGLTVAEVASELLNDVVVSNGIRLIGVGVKGLSAGASEQLSFADVAEPNVELARANVDLAVDEVRRRFGNAAIGPAALRRLDKRGSS